MRVNSLGLDGYILIIKLCAGGQLVIGIARRVFFFLVVFLLSVKDDA